MRVSKRVLITKKNKTISIKRLDNEKTCKIPNELIKFYSKEKDYKTLRKELTKSGVVGALLYDSKAKKQGLTKNTGYQTVHNALIDFCSRPELTYNAVTIERKILDSKKKKVVKSKKNKAVKKVKAVKVKKLKKVLVKK